MHTSEETMQRIKCKYSFDMYMLQLERTLFQIYSVNYTTANSICNMQRTDTCYHADLYNVSFILYYITECDVSVENWVSVRPVLHCGIHIICTGGPMCTGWQSHHRHSVVSSSFSFVDSVYVLSTMLSYDRISLSMTKQFSGRIRTCGYSKYYKRGMEIINENMCKI